MILCVLYKSRMTVMQENIEIIANTTSHHLPLEKNQEGEYLRPSMRCGVLPFYIDKHNQIIWGCVESNRVGPITITPPAGTQDIIVMKEGKEICKLEVAKPFPDLNVNPMIELNLDFLKPFIGQFFRDKEYQNIIRCLIANKFDVFVENPLATALHETQEEHGVDLRDEGKDHHLLHTLFELPLQKLNGKQGATSQYTCLAFLKNGDDVVLNYMEKTENKIQRNLNRRFYEKGCWGAVESFKITLKSEQEKYKTMDKNLYNPKQIELIEGMLAANEDAITFLENMELELKPFIEKLKLEERVACTKPSVAMLEKHSIFNLNKPDTYCGFKPGFLHSTL